MTEKSTFDLFNEIKLVYLLYLSIPSKKLSLFDHVSSCFKIQNIQSKLMWIADGDILMYINYRYDVKGFKGKETFGLSPLKVFDLTLLKLTWVCLLSVFSWTSLHDFWRWTLHRHGERVQSSDAVQRWVTSRGRRQSALNPELLFEVFEGRSGSDHHSCTCTREGEPYVTDVLVWSSSSVFPSIFLSCLFKETPLES